MEKSTLPLRNPLFSVKVKHNYESSNIFIWQVYDDNDDDDIDISAVFCIEFPHVINIVWKQDSFLGMTCVNVMSSFQIQCLEILPGIIVQHCGFVTVAALTWAQSTILIIVWLFFQGFRVNDKVLASWSDCRFYPATVLAVNKDGMCALFNKNQQRQCIARWAAVAFHIFFICISNCLYMLFS